MIYRLLIPYGSAESRRKARSMLENVPEILRLDLDSSHTTFRICTAATMDESTLLAALRNSGLDGFECRQP